MPQIRLIPCNIETKANPKVLLFRCLECQKLFPENSDGEADTGLKRPMCPECFEEIDIESVGEYEADGDATGFPY
jgi:hypothetical protein